MHILQHVLASDLYKLSTVDDKVLNANKKTNFIFQYNSAV